MIKKWKLVRSRHLFNGNRIAVRKDTLKIHNGRITDYEILECPDFVGIVAMTKDRKIILVRQYRPALRQITLEIPAGGINKGETAKQAALRELEEETGYRAGKIRKITHYHSLIGRSASKTHIFFATDLKLAKAKEDEEEVLEVIETDPKQALEMLKKGKITSAPSVAGILGVQSLGLIS